MKFIKIGLLLLLILTTGMFAYFKIKQSKVTISNPPVIEDSIKILHVNSDFTYDDLYEGLTATDDVDGDITDQIMIGEISSLAENNTASYNCVVFDSDGQCSEFNRKMVIDDYAHPRIYLTSPLLYYTIEKVSGLPRSQFIALDKIDGDITDKIEFSGKTVDFTEYGDYFLTAKVENSFGDSVSYEFPVHVRDKSSPLFIYLSQYVVYCSLNSNFDPMRYVRETSNDLVTVQTPYDLSIRSNVDTSNPGVYEVEYTLSGETTSNPAITYLVVIVLEE